jgi:hypothetical protein
MSLRGFWAAVCLGAACAAVSAACSSGSSHGTSGGGDGGAEDASTSDVSVADAPSPGDARSDGAPSTGEGGGDASENLDSGIALDAGDCGVGASGEATDLRCAGLYSDWATKTIAPGIVQYAPGLQLWSDGATKTRWIQLPPGQKIDTSNMDEWTFPVGTKFWKEFRMPSGDGGTVRIETRLIWKLPANEWYDTTYRWSDDGETSATELTAGELDANGVGYEVPSQYECADCHQGRLDNVMGFEAVGLSAPGTTGITIADLVEAGTLTAPPAGPIVIPGNAVESAALGWLHVNCGEACHNSGNGIGGPSGLLTRLDVATLTSVQTTEAYVTAWNQLAGSYTIPTANTTYLLHACDVAESAVYYRPSVRDGIDGIAFGNQMPPIDTHKVDDAGLAILSAWINEGCDGGDGG